MTDIQLQIAIAKLLPEKIASHRTGTIEFYWIVTGATILPTEWEHIVRLMEEKLNPTERVNYISALWKLCPDSSKSMFEYTPQGYNDIIWWWLTHASWQQRAQAILKVKGVV